MVHLMMYCVGIIICTPEVIGRGKGFLIETEDQLEDSLSAAQKIYSQDLCILDVHLDTQ